MTPIQAVNELISIIDEIKNIHKSAEVDLCYSDQEYNDLTHALEFNRFNAFEGFKLAKEMQENRHKRREAKDTLEQLKPLIDLINKNPKFLNELKNAKADIEITINKHRKRKYEPRVRDDLFA